MAKDDKKDKKTKKDSDKSTKKDAKTSATKKSGPVSSSEYKYTVKTIAAERGIAEASVRLAFRKAGIATNEDGVYGWNTKADKDAAVAQAWSSEKAA